MDNPDNINNITVLSDISMNLLIIVFVEISLTL